MKIIHWVVVFILIIVPFSLVCRNIINTKFVALKDEVRINNAIDTATHDAVDLLAEISEISDQGKLELNTALCQAAIDQFLNTMAVNYNIPYNDESKTYLETYIPAIIVVGYDGFYMYSAEETATGVRHILKPKIPYSYRDAYGNIINFTLDNNATVYVASLGKTFSGELYKKGTYADEANALKGVGIDYLPYLTSNLSVMLDNIEKSTTARFESFLRENDPTLDYKYDTNGVLQQDAGLFHQKRREVITNLIVSALEEEVMQHNSFAQMLGVDYTFNIPDISKDEWINAIDDISVISFIQGIPIGIDEHYNNYALGGSRITRGNYFYGGKDNKYHREGCSQIYTGGSIDYSKVTDIFLNKQTAATYQNGKYSWCPICKP